MNVVVLADTHTTAAKPKDLPAEVWTAAAQADVILHAGDVTDATLLDRLAELAPVHAVLGNNDDADLAARLPETLEVRLGGVSVAMIHEAGPTKGRAARMRRRFPDAEVVIFGHSHEPSAVTGVDGQLLFNPGSPTTRRQFPSLAYGRLELAGGRVLDHRIVLLGPRP